MLNVTFIKKKRAPNFFKPITYHVDECCRKKAEEKATCVFQQEHKYLNYDKVVITETRVL